MPGQPLPIADALRIIDEAANPVIQKYGIKDHEGFKWALMCIAGYESSFIPDNIGAAGEVGLFQCHPGGRGAGHNVDQLKDPLYNATISANELGAIWADGERKGQDTATLQRRLIAEGQRPASSEDAMAAFRRVEQELQPQMPAGRQTTAGQGATQDMGLTPGQWVEQTGMMPAAYGADWENPQPGERGDYWISQQMPEYRKWIFEQYSSAMGLGEADVPAWEREATEATTKVNLARAQQIIQEIGELPYNKKRQEILDKIDQENWTAEQAIREFNAWMSGALEAGKRAETVYGEEMKRKAWTTPGEYYPGSEPGGPREQWTEKYGVPYTPSPGIAVETLPSQEQMYGQWHQNMGISQQAPPTQGGWSGQGAGQGAPQGKGYEAAAAFLAQLQQRYAPQFGAARA